MVLTKSQNETHGFIALSLEGNSGIDNGDLANPTPFVFLADPMIPWRSQRRRLCGSMQARQNNFTYNFADV
jgi:hypothetical protein